MPPPITIRPLTAADAAAVRALVEAQTGGTPYSDIPRAALRAALDAAGDEARTMVAVRDEELVGVVLYGLVAGAVGAGRVHLIAVTAAARLRGVGTELVDAATRALGGAGARFVCAELPDDPMLRPALTLLERCGFAEEARVPHFFRDGVALLLLRRELRRER